MASEVETALQNGEVEDVEEMEEADDNDPSEIKELGDPNKPVRIVNKTKRHRSHSGGDAPAQVRSGVTAALAKNSRKPRDGRGRGEPKKG